MTAESALHVDGIAVRFRVVTALDAFSLRIASGESVALTGPNGAGKSTALRAIVRRVPLAAGRIEVGGFDILAHWPAVKTLIGYVPDKDDHFDEFTGRRNLDFYSRLHGVETERVDECLGLVDLTAAADRPVSTYSLGMRRRLLIARALLHRPKLLLLDEPLANLDDDGASMMRSVLRSECGRGAAVLLTTHHRDSIAPFWDREVRLVAGRAQA